jgi:glutaminyl-tRNA synthetase
VEQSLKNPVPGSQYQFERLGYFCADEKDTKDGRPVFNRVVSLRDSWTKVAAKS